MTKNKSPVVKLKQEVTADLTLTMRAELIICHPILILIDFMMFIVFCDFVQNPANQRFSLIIRPLACLLLQRQQFPVAFLAGIRGKLGIGECPGLQEPRLGHVAPAPRCRSLGAPVPRATARPFQQKGCPCGTCETPQPARGRGTAPPPVPGESRDPAPAPRGPPWHGGHGAAATSQSQL